MTVGTMRRITRIWERHALREMPGLLRKNLLHLAHPRRTSAAPDPFDRLYGTYTTATVEAGALGAQSANVRWAKRYEATSAARLAETIARLPIDPEDFVFVDFGSGKGRILLAAAMQPFRRVIGVEFAPELHETALNNVALFPAALRRAPIEPVLMDAVEFPLPACDLVCYFGNPFGPPALARLAAHTRSGYRVFVVYYNPVHAGLFAPPAFAPLWREPMMLVLRT